MLASEKGRLIARSRCRHPQPHLARASRRRDAARPSCALESETALPFALGAASMRSTLYRPSSVSRLFASLSSPRHVAAHLLPPSVGGPFAGLDCITPLGSFRHVGVRKAVIFSEQG